jgi:hypothetical protein
MASNIESAGSVRKQIGENYYSFRYVVTRLDIYQNVNVEIFNETGGEGEPIVTKVIAVIPTLIAASYGDSEIQKIEWVKSEDQLKLEYNLDTRKGPLTCTLDFGNPSKAEQVLKAKTVCN